MFEPKHLVEKQYQQQTIRRELFHFENYTLQRLHIAHVFKEYGDSVILVEKY